MRVFENRVLWKISGPKRDEVKREWTKVHNEELYDLYSSPILFELSNRVMWTISGPKRDEVKREWRKIHNEELYDLYSSPILFELSNQE